MSCEPIDIELIDKTKYIPDFLEISYSKNFEKAGLAIIAKKNIFIGEELLYNYGVNYNNNLK